MAEDSLRINYKSDFDFFLSLKDAQGVDVGFPDFDWRAVIYTSGSKCVEIGCQEGVCQGCFNDNGRIHVVMNDHGLLPGRLKIEVFANLPDAIYPDGYRLLCTPDKGDILLVTGKGDTDALDSGISVVMPALEPKLPKAVIELVGSAGTVVALNIFGEVVAKEEQLPYYGYYGSEVDDFFGVWEVDVEPIAEVRDEA